MKGKIKKFLKEHNLEIIGIIIIFLVLIGGTLLIESGEEGMVLIILLLLIYGVISLYQEKKGVEKKYSQLLRFAHKFYKKYKKMIVDEYDSGDYTLGDFETDFENWLEEKKMKTEEYFKNCIKENKIKADEYDFKNYTFSSASDKEKFENRLFENWLRNNKN